MPSLKIQDEHFSPGKKKKAKASPSNFIARNPVLAMNSANQTGLFSLPPHM